MQQQGQWQGTQGTLLEDDIRRLLQVVEDAGGFVDVMVEGRNTRTTAFTSLRRLLDQDPAVFGQPGSHRRWMFQKKWQVIKRMPRERYEQYRNQYLNPAANVQEG